MIKIIRIIIFLIVSICTYSAPSYSADINPSIETISTGPFSDDYNPIRYRFRLVTYLSEVSYSVQIERIEYGDENCCKKIVNSFEIEPSLIEGKYQLYSVSNIQWTSHNSLKFKGNSTVYNIKNLDSKYTVTKE